jgi:hypothetical protein
MAIRIVSKLISLVLMTLLLVATAGAGPESPRPNQVWPEGLKKALKQPNEVRILGLNPIFRVKPAEGQDSYGFHGWQVLNDVTLERAEAEELMNAMILALDGHQQTGRRACANPRIGLKVGNFELARCGDCSNVFVFQGEKEWGTLVSSGSDSEAFAQASVRHHLAPLDWTFDDADQVYRAAGVSLPSLPGFRGHSRYGPILRLSRAIPSPLSPDEAESYGTLVLRGDRGDASEERVRILNERLSNFSVMVAIVQGFCGNKVKDSLDAASNTLTLEGDPALLEALKPLLLAYNEPMLVTELKLTNMTGPLASQYVEQARHAIEERQAFKLSPATPPQAACPVMVFYTGTKSRGKAESKFSIALIGTPERSVVVELQQSLLDPLQSDLADLLGTIQLEAK